MPNDHTDDMTAEELEAFIAERAKPENLPAWWEQDTGASERQLRQEGARQGNVRRARGRK